MAATKDAEVESGRSDKEATRIINHSWPFRGGEARDIGVDGASVAAPLADAAPDEVVARVDAVCICSSDIKLIRMGASHPLFAARDLVQDPLILGHEMALTVHEVGENWRHLYRPGQRLGLQPAITRDGKRVTIGIDRPGAFSQYVRLTPEVLSGDIPYVFDVPETLSAAQVAMLEPYSCVEAAYRPNSRITLKPDGRLLIVCNPGATATTIDLDVSIAEAVLVGAPPALVSWAETHAERCVVLGEGETLPDGSFDDVVLCGKYDPLLVEAMLGRLADGGLLAIIASDADGNGVTVDAARIHYRQVSIVGAPGPRIEAAFSSERNRFELRRDGVLLILGAGGAMGRIHLHRAIEMDDGPRVIVATSRKGARLDGLVHDFGPLAERRGKQLLVVPDAEVAARLAAIAPDGCDDVAVVAPDAVMVERGAGFMRPDGLLVIFAGMPFGQPCRLPLGQVASHGARFTGSTGSAVADQLSVLDHVLAGRLDLANNLEAVSGFRHLPEALEAVSSGRVSGKIAIYPFVDDLPMTPVSHLVAAGRSWTLADEARLAADRGEDA